MEPHKTLISLTDVKQVFKIGTSTSTVLKDISIELPENSFTIVYGPSGSGKSTLINIIAGLQKPTHGTMTFDNQDVYKLSPDELAHFRINTVGMVYQRSNWVHSLNVVENVALPLLFSGRSRRSAHRAAMASLTRVGVKKLAKRNPSLLSSGEQQRIAVARALINDPKVIIADEPTGNLDRENSQLVIDLLQTCQREFGKTIILITHNMEYILAADTVVRIADGTIAKGQQGSGEAIFNQMLTELQERQQLYTQKTAE